MLLVLVSVPIQHAWPSEGTQSHTQCFNLQCNSSNDAHILVFMQMIQIVLWVYAFQYYIYPFVLLAVLFMGIATSVGVLYRQKARLAALTTQTFLIPYVNKGYIRAMKGSQLVPGDVIVVQPGVAVCDLVLLRGSCLVEDASLTGEVILTQT